MSENNEISLICPVCGNQIEYIEETAMCKNCGYTSDPVKAAKLSETDKYRKDAAVYRLMTAADTYFSRKNYYEAYIEYSSVLDSDPHCLKAIFRLDITGQYLMYETASVYLSCEAFFHKTRKILASALENTIDEKLMLTMCKDMLNFITFCSEYERKYALSHKSKQNALTYLSNMLVLLDHTRFIMNCIISVNKRDSAFAAMKCFETGSELHGRILSGMEYPSPSEPDSMKKCELSHSEISRANGLYNELSEIKQRIMKNADDALYAELKALEKKKGTDKPPAASAENFQRSEYENWRRRNEEEYVSADRKSIVLGIISKAAFLFAAVTIIIFIIEAVASDDIIKGLAASAVAFIAAGAVFSAFERHSEKKRRFYARLVYSDEEQSRAMYKYQDK